MDRSKELKYIKTMSWWTIFGWFLFVIPGLVCSIILCVKTATYKNYKESNNAIRICAAVFAILIPLVGGILGLVFAGDEGANQSANSYNSQPRPENSYSN